MKYNETKWVQGPVAHQIQNTNTEHKTISDKDMRGNRGLNTQQVMNGIETRCV